MGPAFGLAMAMALENANKSIEQKKEKHLAYIQAARQGLRQELEQLTAAHAQFLAKKTHTEGEIAKESQLIERLDSIAGLLSSGDNPEDRELLKKVRLSFESLTADAASHRISLPDGK